MEDSEHVNETVETFDILTVKKRIKKRAIKKNKKRSDVHAVLDYL